MWDSYCIASLWIYIYLVPIPLRNWPRVFSNALFYASIDSIIFVTHFTGHSVNRSAARTPSATAIGFTYMHVQHFDSNQHWIARTAYRFSVVMKERAPYDTGLLILWLLLDFYWISMFHINLWSIQAFQTIKMLTVLFLLATKYSLCDAC